MSERSEYEKYGGGNSRGNNRNRGDRDKDGDKDGEEASALVRKHFTTFNSFVRARENYKLNPIQTMYRSNYDNNIMLQPHFSSIGHVPVVDHGPSTSPHIAICSHFLQRLYLKAPHRSRLNTACWTTGGRHLIAGLDSGKFAVWEGQHFKFDRPVGGHYETAEDDPTKVVKTMPVTAIEWANYGQMMLSGDEDGGIRYFNSSLRLMYKIPEAHTSAVRSISFSPNDGRFATSSDDAAVKIWSMSTDRPEVTYNEHLAEVRGCKWHPYRSLVLTVSKDSKAKLWDPRQSQSVATIYAHNKHIVSCGWSCGGDYFATGSKDYTVKIFDLRTLGRKNYNTNSSSSNANTSSNTMDVCTMRGHGSEVRALAWHPTQDRLLLTGAFNGSLIYWIVGESHGAHTGIKEAHRNSINFIAWHPVGNLVATASYDGALKFWSRSPPGSQLEITKSYFMGPNGQQEENTEVAWGPQPPPEKLSEDSVAISLVPGGEGEVDKEVEQKIQEKIEVKQQKAEKLLLKEAREASRQNAAAKRETDFSAALAAITANAGGGSSGSAGGVDVAALLANLAKAQSQAQAIATEDSNNNNNAAPPPPPPPAEPERRDPRKRRRG